MATKREEKLRRQDEDEHIFRAIKNRNFVAALLMLFQAVRGVTICKHGSMTSYRPCDLCEAELELGLGWSPEDDQ
jgi:hypothetical protein